MAHISSFSVARPHTQHIEDDTMSCISHGLVKTECNRHTQTVVHPAFRHWIEPTSPGLARSPQKQRLNPLMSLAFRFLPVRVGSESRKMGSVKDPARVGSELRRMGSIDDLVSDSMIASMS